jgi:SAM-dependent methyltransferase
VTHPLAYHAIARTEIVPLLPDPCARVLEIGCGTGATLAHLKSLGLAGWAAGVERAPAAAALAAPRLEAFWAEDVERWTPPIEAGSLDLVLCLDVLEHLAEPWAAVRRLTPLLRPGGALIASLPNLRHYKVSLPLLLRGEFRYDAAGGILDATHLRFFVESTARELVESGGLAVDAVVPLGIKPRTPKAWLLRLSGGRLRGLFARQFLVRGVRRA